MVFSRDFRRPKGAKVNIYLDFVACRGFRCCSPFMAVVVSTCAGGRGCSCYFADVSKNGQNPLPPSLCCFCSWCITLEYGSIWLLKGVFSGFCGADVYLYGLRVLRGLWGFYVREQLGGFRACGVFCLSFCQIVLQIVPLSVLVCSWSWSCVLGFVA